MGKTGTVAAGALAAGAAGAASSAGVAQAATLAGTSARGAVAGGAALRATAGPGAAPAGYLVGAPLPGAEALRLLVEGNQRWARGQMEHPHQTVARRHDLAGHQDPFAIVFSCIDSRVPPEIVFDRGIGDLFVIRTGAQVLDRGIVLGSIEFGPNGYPSAQLILVLGHQRCGAVTTAIDVLRYGKLVPGHLPAVVAALRPAYQFALGQPGDLVANTIRAQVRLTVGTLRADPLLAGLIQRSALSVIGGLYDLESGVVTFIP